MSLSAAEIRNLTHALRSPESALAAMEQLRGCHHLAAIEGLVELIYQPPSAKAAALAIAVLEDCSHPLVVESLAHALQSEHATVRHVAVQALHDRRATHVDGIVHVLLQQDESWPVRRAALRLLADCPAPVRWSILDSADDPHWRVRHALIQVLLKWGEVETDRHEIEARLTDSRAISPLSRVAEIRRAGVLAYLRYRWSGRIAEVYAPEFSFPISHLWDWDVAVLQRNLERLGKAGRRRALDAMSILLGHSDERIRNIAVETLRAHGGPREIAEAMRLLDDLRIGAGEAVNRILQGLHLDRKEAVVQRIFGLADPSPAQRAWAAAQIGTVIPREECPPQVQEWGTGEVNLDRTRGASALLSGSHPAARAAELTPERAQALVRDPLQESSWHVLAEAARLAKTPFWKLEPQKPWQPPKRLLDEPAALTLTSAMPPRARSLGSVPFHICPLGISGHYGLPVEGFVRAYETGVNLMFWEPNYQTMTAFYRRLSNIDLRSIHLIAGTFEADGERIQRDVERVLRVLKIERIALVLLFWVQTWDRVAPDVREVLQRMQREGKIASFGLSTHNRALAVEAMETGWNPVMVRHSAAHRGAEKRIFPKALETGTSVITFNNTCYARMLQPARQLQPPYAADCYRYTLSMPAVRACLSAPATLEQLDENLSVLREMELPPGQLRDMLKFGDVLYQEETTFRKLVPVL